VFNDSGQTGPNARRRTYNYAQCPVARNLSQVIGDDYERRNDRVHLTLEPFRCQEHEHVICNYEYVLQYREVKTCENCTARLKVTSSKCRFLPCRQNAG
jgi:hypothetical protein